MGAMKVHLIDGTYELFRQFFGRPGHLNALGEEVGAARSVLRDMLYLLEGGVTHIGVATDHVIESFRNELYAGYKSGEGLDPRILAQFGPLEEGLSALGLALFPMVEFEADDALGAAAEIAAADPEVEQVLICTPDKDLAQCVTDGRIVQFDRRRDKIYGVAEVIEKYGVPPTSIPDWLGLVGDTADGFPGLKGWGAKSAAVVLTRYGHIENIPLAAGQWDITVRGGAKLAATLAEQLDEALLFRRIATLDLSAPTISRVSELLWTGPTADLVSVADRFDAPDLVSRATVLSECRRTSS